MSCGSPMPRGERIAKPAEWGHPRGRFSFSDSDRSGGRKGGSWSELRWLEIGLNTVRYSLRRERVRLAAVGAVTRLMRGQQPAGGWLYFLQE